MAMTLTGSPQITAALLDAAINAELAANWMPLAGVTDGSNAAAGKIGEFISSTVLVGSAVPVTNAAAQNVTSMSLTAGDWDVSGNLLINAAVSTVLTQIFGWISTVSATLPTAPNGGAEIYWGGNVTGLPLGFSIGPLRVSVASPITVYLSSFINYTTQQPGAYGFLGARRRR